MFEIDTSVPELFFRTSLIYLLLLATLRILGRRQFGSLELPELLMIVLIADGVQNGIAGQYNSITGALVVAGTLIGWNFCLDAAAYRVPALRSVLYPPPLVLAKDGQYLRKNMRGEMVTREELDALLREQGVESVSDVKKACLESDGQFSLIKHTKEGEPTGEPAKRREGAAT